MAQMLRSDPLSIYTRCIKCSLSKRKRIEKAPARSWSGGQAAGCNHSHRITHTCAYFSASMFPTCSVFFLRNRVLGLVSFRVRINPHTSFLDKLFSSRQSLGPLVITCPPCLRSHGPGWLQAKALCGSHCFLWDSQPSSWDTWLAGQ